MDNLYIDEISFYTDILPEIKNFNDTEAKLIKRFNESKEHKLVIPLSNLVVKDSKIRDIRKIARYIEASIKTSRRIEGHENTKSEIASIVEVESLNYRFITKLKGDKDSTELVITPKYKKGSKIWSSITGTIGNLFQRKNK
jgi:predicted polyphosphate/ATP-dependent NAD kinase